MRVLAVSAPGLCCENPWLSEAREGDRALPAEPKTVAWTGLVPELLFREAGERVWTTSSDVPAWRRSVDAGDVDFLEGQRVGESLQLSGPVTEVLCTVPASHVVDILFADDF